MNENPTPSVIATPKTTPAQTPESTSPQTPNQQPNQPPKKKTGMIIGIIVAALVICGGVVAILLLTGKKDPDTIVYNALTNLTTSKQSDHENASVSGLITIGSSDMPLYKISVAGYTNKESLELNLGFDSPLLIGEDNNIGANLIFNQKNLFMKIEGLGDILGNLADIDFSSIEGEWYKLSVDKMAELFIAESDDIDTKQCISDEITTLNIKRDKLSELYHNHHIVSATEYNDTTIAKNKDQLYEISVDKFRLADLINDILIDSKLFEDFYSCMGTSFREVEPIEVEDIEGFNIPVIYAEINKNDEFTRFYLPIEANNTEIIIDFTIDYPAKIEIFEPTEVKNIEDLFTNLMPTEYNYDYDFEFEEEF